MRLFRPYPRISAARAEDATDLADLYLRCWEPLRDRVDTALAGELVPTRAEVEAWFRGGFEIYRAVLDGRTAGVVRVSFPTGAAMLDRLAVDPDLRGRGVGKALVEHAVNRGRRAGVTRAWAHLAPELEEALALHRSLGFRESHRQPGPQGRELVLLELPL